MARCQSHYRCISLLVSQLCSSLALAGIPTFYAGLFDSPSFAEDKHLPLPPPIQCWQYDEIVFNDPYENFLAILTSHPPTPLPPPVPGNMRPIPWHPALPKSILEPPQDAKEKTIVGGEGVQGSSKAVPGFHNQLATMEGARLKEAVATIKSMIEASREALEEKERELTRLRSM